MISSPVKDLGQNASSPAAGLDLSTLSAVAVGLRDSVCITDADLEHGPRIVYVNDAFTRLTGYEAAEVIGRSPRLLQGPRSSRVELDRLRRDLAAGREFQGETINYRRDGSEFTMGWYVIPVRDQAGRITHYFGVQRDVTSTRRGEAASQLFRAAFDHTMGVMIILDEAGQIQHANAACLAMVGAARSEIVGQTARAIGLAPRRLRVYREIIRSLADDDVWCGEYESSARHGEPRRLSVSITRVHTRDPAPCYVVDARDVTHQRRLEYIAEATNLVENVGYVFAGIRHELGNPVNSIKTALTVVRQSLGTLSRERVEDYLDRVLQEVARVEYLLRSLQSFGATHRPVLEPVPVVPFLSRFATIIRPDVERRGVTLTLAAEEPTLCMVADARALHQVMLNLLTNALDALVGRAAPRIRILAGRRGPHVVLSVTDNGAGIPLARRGHLFKPFHTTKHKGTGLGLAITRKLVTLMRGTIELEHVNPGETTFTVTLDAEAAEGGRASSTSWPPPRMAP